MNKKNKGKKEERERKGKNHGFMIFESSTEDLGHVNEVYNVIN